MTAKAAISNKVLVTAPYFMPMISTYEDRFHQNGIELVPYEVGERASEEELLGIIGDKDGVLCGDDKFTDRVLAAAPRLKVIAKWGTGIDSIDREACAKRGIKVLNTPNAFSIPVADSVLGYALSFVRNLPWMDRAVKNGIWKKIPGRSLSECTFGIIGVGNVGGAVATRAAAFGGVVLGNDIRPIDPTLISKTGLVPTSLEDLLTRCDIVSLNCDLNPTSRHLICAQTLSLMKNTAVLINTARGPIIKETDLIEALREKRLGGAAFDVFEDEPLPTGSPLRSMDNVMLAPHNSNSSPRAWAHVHENTVNQLISELLS